MTVNFSPPSYRAGGSDLAISISPLGLVELADEEFEVHGPRLNRYALSWAMYLGHHWGYRREMGEPQVTVNFHRAFTDYLINFTFGKGIQFRSPRETEHIIPSLLKRVWEDDNDKASVLYEIGQQGAVSGDAFIKVAYEDAFTDPSGRFNPGQVKILPLNSSFCFPEWHPHNRNRLIRFKLKYRFWGTSLEGTRQVFTYTEILTDEMIEEYINDELIDQRENPLGRIPIVHIANRMISGVPWGQGDCEDIITLNKEYNEKCTDISDIINYHAAPITIITGAKANNLDQGPKKVWGGLPKDSKVFNLELGGDGLTGPIAYLQILKTHMHELVGVPETALGQVQPISNTSGVALSIQFQPLMNRWQQKTAQYGMGLEKVNELILMTLFMKEPETLQYDAGTDDPDLREGQPLVLDPNDPLIYKTVVHWNEPLPLDKMIKLQEITMSQQMGLESRVGALRQLGEEFPDLKLEEIRQELKEDAIADGALKLIHATIAAEIFELTGMMPGADGQPEMATQMADQTESTKQSTTAAGGKSTETKTVTPVPAGPRTPMTPDELLELQGEADIRTRLVRDAYGTGIPLRRMPNTGGD